LDANSLANWRPTERLQELAGIHAIACDVTVPSAAQATVEEVVARLGGLDAVVYATGITRINPLDEASYDDWLELYTTNIFGAALITRAALPHLVAEGSQGRAVYLTSDSAEMPYPGMVVYCSSKAALSAYARGLANEYRSLKVTEVVVGPTAGTEVGNQFDPEAFAAWAPRWFDEGFLRYSMLQLDEVVPMIVDVLVADQPPAVLRAAGAEDNQTLDEVRELAGADQPALGSGR
jgi:NAD(P)-dependent dehydrogenase (short-subunit alcohol dehydrogenase family)